MPPRPVTRHARPAAIAPRLGSTTRRSLLAVFVLAAALASSSIASPVRAHEPFEITTTVRALSDRTELRALFADRTAAAVCLGKARRREALQELPTAVAIGCATALFEVRGGADVLGLREVESRFTPEMDWEVRLTYPPASPARLAVRAPFLARLEDPTFGAALTVSDEHRVWGQKVLRASDDTWPDPPRHGFAATLGAFVSLGFWHILSGADHLLFLAGLLLATPNLRTALGLITSFTLAHSATLGAAVVGLPTPPTRLVEALIAASVIWVGLENLRARAMAPWRRVAMTFSFGLVHGFGFASALFGLVPAGARRSVGQVALPLAGFNLGVEGGQLLVVGLLLPFLVTARRRGWLGRRAMMLCSLSIATTGLAWLVIRLR